MKQRFAWVMRVPIFVPLLLLVISASLFAIDVVSVVNATREPVAYHVSHSDDNQTFVAAVLVPLDPEEELRSPDGGGWRGWIVVRDHGSESITLSNTLSNRSSALAALHERSEFLVIPAWQIDQLARGEDVLEMHHAQSLEGLRFVPGEIPSPEGVDVHGWSDSLAVVWRLKNTTDDYPLVAQAMMGQGGGAIPDLYAVQGNIVARDPWLRGAAVVLAAGALALSLVPRMRHTPAGLPEAPAGASVELAAAGRVFLTSIRNAYVALAAAVVLLGVPLMLAIVLFAKQAVGPAGHLEFIGTGDPWEGTVWLQMFFIAAAGTVAAARPALDAHLALRRWKRSEGSPPIEGELAP